ncbi:helix-turn-helix protein [Herbihabitans rhizosphaerae]|uniref:Helix-turn-helix protein n=1 Tax=Herbihabitans rhizosphaerae TaxID=1872711 RepID=A0A4V2EUH5_9PSEU|nr:helix-turn-helix transcriptional regulator [Herbihabitans rhizosphaerae]RZS44593.1 helix-turn-helix protein [Herbihabitans rhizosphaerae]
MSSFQKARELLAQRLRVLRQDAGLTGRELAGTTGWPSSKISKIEGGRQTPADDDLRAWARACGVPEAVDDLIAAARNLDGHYVENRRKYRAGMAGPQRRLAEQESTLTTIRGFEDTVIPGLLQTPEYARYMFATGRGHGGGRDDLDQAVAARMARQHVLYDPTVRVHMVATEAVLRYRFCPPGVMAGQLDRLVGAVSSGVIRFGVIPFVRPGLDPPMHGFWSKDDDEVHVETMSAALTLSEPSEISTYLDLFSHYAKAAVYGAEARAIIERAAEDTFG